MKRKIFGGIAVVAVVAAITFNVKLNAQKGNVSLLALSNVEALAGGEVDFPYFCMGDSGPCYVETDWTVIRGKRLW